MRAIVCVLGFLMLAGCENLPATQATVERLQNDVTALRAQASTMPSDSPDRKLIEANADKVQKVLNDADAALKAIQSGDPSGLTPLANSVPYGGLALALATIVWREYKLRQTRTALEQTVTGVESAFPTGKPDPVKTALATAQDSTTKAMVESIKSP